MLAHIRTIVPRLFPVHSKKKWAYLSIADASIPKRQTLVCDSSCIGKLGCTYSSLSHILTHLLCHCKGTLSCVWYRHHRRQLKALEMEWKTIGTVPARTPWQVSVLAQSQRSTLSGTSTLTVKDCMLPVPRNSSLAWCGVIAQPTTGLHWHLDQMQKCIVSQWLQPATTVHAPIAHWTKQLLNSTCVCKVGQFFCLFSWVQMLWILDLITNLCY